MSVFKLYAVNMMPTDFTFVVLVVIVDIMYCNSNSTKMVVPHHWQLQYDIK